MRTRFLLFFLAMTMFPWTVFAQDALEEVIVTAQRREQSLQDVPVSITAFSGAMLDRLNIREATDYLKLTPNVSFTEDGQVGTRGINISVRGISNINTDADAFIQSVGTYLDEFSVAFSATRTINPQLQDLERVEVLRGPQGTYFGRNSVGGALNLTTRKPVDHVEGKVSAGVETYETRGTKWYATGVLNVPLTDTFFLRGAAYYEDSTGLVENIVPGGSDSGYDYQMGRLAARWLASDATTVDAMIMHTNEDQGTDETVPSGVWDTDTVATFGLPQPPQIPSPLHDGTGFWPENRDQKAHSAIGEKNDLQSTIGILKISHRFSDRVVLNSITGFIDSEFQRVFDNDLLPENLVITRSDRESYSWSTELRLEMSTDQFDWVIGGLYAEDEIDSGDLSDPTLGTLSGTTTAVDGAVSLLPVPVPGPTVVDFAATGALPPLFLTQFTPDGQPPLCLTCSEVHFDGESRAIFTDFTWHATEQLDLTVGGRYTEDELSQVFLQNGLFRTPRIPDENGNPIGPSQSQDWSDFSPRFVAAYHFTDEFNGYAVVSKGYKPGGFSQGYNTNVSPNEIIEQEFDEETLWNYEVGIKSEWFDDRLRFNAAAFYIDWSDLQLESFFFLTPGDPTSNFQLTINVEEAEAYGFETEFVALPMDGLTLSGGIGYTETEIESDTVATLSGNIPVSLQGRPVPRSPEWTVNLTGEYRWPWNEHEMYVGAEFVYRDSQFATIEDVTWEQSSGAPIRNNAGEVIGQVPIRTSFPFETPSYELVNLRAGVLWDEKLEFTLYVHNLFDKEYYTGTGENFGISGFRLKPHPRYFGGTVTYRFGGY